MKNRILFPFLTLALLNLFMAVSTNLSAQTDKKTKSKSLIVTLSASSYSSETGKGLVLVDFCAPWCGPCRRMAPILEELAEEHKETVKIGKVNVDNYKQFSIDQGIQALPTIVVYKDGKEVTRVVGLASKDDLKKIIEKYSVKAAN